MKKLEKRILVFLFMLLLFSSIAYAEKVAYILSNVNFPKQELIDILEDMDFTVDKIDNEDIATVNLSKYSFMLINNNIFSNEDEIPVNEFPALILNANHMDEWHWIDPNKMSQKSSSQPLKANINDPTNFITFGFPSTVKIYDSSVPSVYYLHRYYKAPQLKTLVSTGSSTTEKSNAIIATAEPGTKLKGGYSSHTKSVFFGITETDYWTSNTGELFRNSALWLVTDMVAPLQYDIKNTSITNSFALISWYTDKNANSTVLYGSDLSLSASKLDNSFVLYHEILLDGLNEKTTYYYKVKSCNDDAYCSESEIYSFTTLDLTAPYLISNSIEDITNSSVNISVETNENSYSTIYYGTNNESLEQTTPQSGLATLSYFEINGLDEKATYYYSVEMCDDSNNCRNSSIFDFTILDLTPPNPPQNLVLEVINPNDIRIRWNSALDDAIKYNVYISSNPDNFNFEVPSATTSLNKYVDGDASSEQQRYYVVRAEDTAGNEEKNTNVVGKFDLELTEGYNLISLPLVPFTNSIADIMHQSILFNPVSEIKRFDNLKQEFETTTYIAFIWNPLSFQELNYGQGYFFKSDYDINLTIVGILPTITVLDIKQGMNLFGLASLENKDITDVIVQTPAEYNVTEIGKRNEGGAYSLATYYPSGWNNAFVLEPGVGYWLKANKDFSLTLEP